MSPVIERFKPGASRRTQAFAAASLWTAVGLGLSVAGGIWCSAALWPWPPILAGTGIVLGGVKGTLVIVPAARRIFRRILAREDGSCLGGAFSWKSWLLVVVMMGAGILLRRSPLPRPLLGLIYSAVGVALLVGGASLWRLSAQWPEGS